ncbi:MAG: hypothetical protein SGJ01_13975 [Gemmatimonadota bacterium]|nr:hypothetical protein [Gemmatimonadota bacterium]
MHHPVLRALGAVLSVALLLVQLADGTGVHRCPAHDGAAVPPAAVSHHAAMQHHQAPASDHQHGGACTCLGACHGAAFALGAADSTPRLEVGAPGTTSVAALAGAVPAFLPRLLPFANGPPRLVSSRFA